MSLSGTITTTNGPEHSLAQLKRANREGLWITVEYWHRQFAPLHFEESAYQRYGYAKRKGQDEPPRVPRTWGVGLFKQKKITRIVNNPKYYWKKFRKVGHHRPLVYDGIAKHTILRSIRMGRRKVEGAGLITVSGAMDAPKYFYQYNKALGAPDKYAELIKTIPAESEEMLRCLNRAIDKELRDAAARRPVKRVRI